MKRWARLSLIMALLMIISACGGGDDEGTATTAAAGDGGDTTETTAASGDGGETTDTTASPDMPDCSATGDTVIRWIYGAPIRQPAIDIVNEYNAMDNGVCVEIVAGPSSATDLLATYLQTFEAQSSDLDVLQIDVIWPGDLAEHLVDLNDFGAGDVTGDMFESIVQNNTVDGRLVGIPGFTDAPMLYYRTDLLEKYGFEPPTTWVELEDQARTIMEGEQSEGNPDFTGFVWQGNAYEGLTCDALEWVASNGGGTIIDKESETITINNPEAAAAIETAASWVGDISPVGVTGFQEEDSRAVWMAGNAAFMRNWPYAYSLGNADDSTIKGLFDTVPLPAAEGQASAATLGGWQQAVSNYSEHKQEAADFALWISSPEIQKRRMAEESLLPTIPSIYDDAELQAQYPFFATMKDVLANSVARPSTISAPNYNDVSLAFFNAVHSVLTGEANADDALAELELDLEDITGLSAG